MSKKTILTTIFSALALVGTVAAPTILVSTPALAQAGDAKAVVDAAKASGVIGETASGYLAVVTSAPREIVNAMNEINIRRKSAYTRLAREQNLQIDVVAALTAEKVRAKKAKSGEKYLDKNGEWITNP